MSDESGAMKAEGIDLVRLGRLEEARVLFDSICRNDADDAEAWFWLGRVNGKLGNFDAAGDCCRRAIALRSDYSEAYVNLGKALLMQDRHEEAVGMYQAALRLDPSSAEAYADLGHILFSHARYEDAAECYEAVVRLQPQSADAVYNLGNIRRIQKKFSEAVSCYEKAILINPGLTAAYNNLGVALYKQGQVGQAIRQYQSALDIDPSYAEAYNNLGIVLRERGDMDEAERMFNQALQLNPRLIEAYLSLGAMRNRQGDAQAAMALFKKALGIAPTRADIQSSILMTMAYLPQYSSGDLYNAARLWGQQHTPSGDGMGKFTNSPEHGRRLRIGYVSADFNAHPVAYFIEPVLLHHDRSEYEVFCYYNKTMSDEYTSQLQANSDHWRDIAGQSDLAVLRQIHRDRIDILVDLSGHTVQNRLPVFARRAAPVQATWMGYFATTGMPAMDYIIADHFVIPSGQEDQYVERVTRLPHSYLCFSPPRSEVDVSPLPALDTGVITFGCFNNPAKQTREVIECWLRLLTALPRSHLYIKYRGADSAANQARYRALFEEAGISLDRLRLSGYSPRAEILAAYQEVDIALDPFPYNGGTTTAEALWMGVPVITLRGDRFVGRVGESLLKGVGLDGLVAGTQDEYVSKALALAVDIDALVAMRAGLRNKLLSSSLCDASSFTHSLEKAYRDMWRDWCHT